MFLLWPDGICHNDVFLLVTQLTCMIKAAGTTIKVLYSKMIYATCSAHGIHCVAEDIRGKFFEID